MYLKLLSCFAKIGAFTIGGGYAMIPIIEREVVHKAKWMSEDEFMDVLSVSQSAPGLLAVNISIFVGYKLKGFKGSIVATIGSILPPFLIILMIAIFFSNFLEIPVIEKAFKGIRPVVVALIAVPMLKMAIKSKLNFVSVAVVCITIALVSFFHVSPIWILGAVSTFTAISIWTKLKILNKK